MACACQKQSNVQFEVKLRDGSVRRYDTSSEGQAAIRAAKGGTMKAVQRAT